MAGIPLNKNIGIIGGGITGVICAIFLAKEGNKVTIFERKELLGETSSRTTKLLHGGIRYLENLQLSEVKNGLNDRYWWLENFPDNTKKIEIMIPFRSFISLKFLKYLFGIKIYEFLSFTKKLGKGRIVINSNKFQSINQTKISNYLSFFDGAMDDKLLGSKLKEQLRDLNVTIHEYCEVKNFNNRGQINDLTFDQIILAAGPWTNILMKNNSIDSDKEIDFIKGSHLVINKKITNGFMFEGICKTRYIFALPYNDKTLLGTTEKRVNTPEDPYIENDEKDYLIKSYNSIFTNSIKSTDIDSSFSGVRPLIKSAKNIHKSSRDFYVQQDDKLISIFGGKWTTAPSIARKVVTIINNE